MNGSTDYIGLSGRAWLVKGSVFLALLLIFVIVPVGKWVIGNRELLVRLWNVLPWILAVLVCVKIAATTCVARRLHATRLLSGRSLIVGATSWTAVVLALFGLLVWFVPTTLLKGHVLALVAILAVPVARLARSTTGALVESTSMKEVSCSPPCAASGASSATQSCE